MSMRSWSENGYGFQLYNGNNFNKVANFCVGDRSKYDKDVLESIDSAINCEDEFELCNILDGFGGWAELAPVVAEKINKETGLNCFCGYQGCSNTDVEAHIGIGPQYPWEDKAFNSQEEANVVLTKYAGILGITEKPDFFSLEYCG